MDLRRFLRLYIKKCKEVEKVDTSQYMSMFLEESMDNLQSLNESLLQLEQEPGE